jgi:hypothetical protein
MTRPGQARRPGWRKFKERNAPPKGEGQNWAWFTREMLESLSWRALNLASRRVVERVIIEHLKHGGTQNGDLPVTFADFQESGVPRCLIKASIELAVALGWIDVVERGVRGYGPARRPTRYGLTWLPRADWTAASNRWRLQTWESIEKALVAFETARRRANGKRNFPRLPRPNRKAEFRLPRPNRKIQNTGEALPPPSELLSRVRPSRPSFSSAEQGASGRTPQAGESSARASTVASSSLSSTLKSSRAAKLRASSRTKKSAAAKLPWSAPTVVEVFPGPDMSAHLKALYKHQAESNGAPDDDWTPPPGPLLRIGRTAPMRR